MATYEDGYDPKLGYNLNAFAHPTLPLKAIGTVVKLIVNPLGLASEAIYNYEDGKRAAGSSTSPESPSGDRPPFASEEANVAVMDGQAEELTAGGRDNSAVGHACVPELLPECEHREVETGVVDNDEVDWALDDAALGTGDPPPQNTVEQFTIEQLDEAPFGRGLDNGQHPENPRGTLNHMNKLPYPVVLPQRRPGTKARGFVRAYAPVLQDTGIEQEMFLQFLKSLHNATQASPVFKCIMVGTAIAGAVPDLSVALAMQALQIAAGICQEMQQRWRMNRFLIQANKELFMPRGLLALVVTYKMGEDDGAGIVTATVDIGATAFVKYGDELSTDNVDGDPESSSAIQKRLQRLKEKSKRLRVASAATHVWEMPADCASLIYPDLDRIQDEEVGGDEARQSKTLKNIKSKSRSTSKFVNDYFDWRARATFVSDISTPATHHLP